MALTFLSTPPSRVATILPSLQNTEQQVSIHATLAGGDTHWFAYTAPAARFYPRHPRGWRPETWQISPLPSCVSIHATLAGGDAWRWPG